MRSSWTGHQTMLRPLEGHQTSRPYGAEVKGCRLGEDDSPGNHLANGSGSGLNALEG